MEAWALIIGTIGPKSPLHNGIMSLSLSNIRFML